MGTSALLLAASLFALLIVTPFWTEYQMLVRPIGYMATWDQYWGVLFAGNSNSRYTHRKTHVFNLILATTRHPTRPYYQRILQSYSTDILAHVGELMDNISDIQIHSYEASIDASSTSLPKDVWLQAGGPSSRPCSDRVCEHSIVIHIHEQACGANATSISSGHQISGDGCVVTLPLVSQDQYAAADADAIYNATALITSCLWSQLAVPLDVVPSQEVSGSPLQITRAQVQGFRATALSRLILDALERTKVHCRLRGYDASPWLALLASSDERDMLREIFTVLGQVVALTTAPSISEGQGVVLTPGLMEPLLPLARRAHDLPFALDTLPAGRLRAAAPWEQHFAVYGPYWLPLLVPVFKVLRAWGKWGRERV